MGEYRRNRTYYTGGRLVEDDAGGKQVADIVGTAYGGVGEIVMGEGEHVGEEGMQERVQCLYSVIVGRSD